MQNPVASVGKVLGCCGPDVTHFQPKFPFLQGKLAGGVELCFGVADRLPPCPGSVPNACGETRRLLNAQNAPVSSSVRLWPGDCRRGRGRAALREK